jgi:regulator of sigma E protease
VSVGGGGGGGTGSGGPAFTGPVGIADQTGEIIKEAGWRPLIEMAALLSLNLAIFNALPIPMLDGGRMFFVFVEILRGGRRISPEKEALVHFTGFALMMASVVVVTYFDIARIVS